MNYWVYENKVAKRARIHVSECRYCNDGKGVGGDTTNDDDKWHGPYNKFSQAEKTANGFSYSDVRPCGVCKPEAKGVTLADVAPAIAAASASEKKTTKPAAAPKAAPRPW